LTPKKPLPQASNPTNNTPQPGRQKTKSKKRLLQKKHCSSKDQKLAGPAGRRGDPPVISAVFAVYLSRERFKGWLIALMCNYMNIPVGFLTFNLNHRQIAIV
jgi:hypothetical protein